MIMIDSCGTDHCYASKLKAFNATYTYGFFIIMWLSIVHRCGSFLVEFGPSVHQDRDGVNTLAACCDVQHRNVVLVHTVWVRALDNVTIHLTDYWLHSLLNRNVSSLWCNIYCKYIMENINTKHTNYYIGTKQLLGRFLIFRILSLNLKIHVYICTHYVYIHYEKLTD